MYRSAAPLGSTGRTQSCPSRTLFDSLECEPRGSINYQHSYSERVSAFHYVQRKKLRPLTHTEISETINFTSLYRPPEPSVPWPTKTTTGVLLPKCLNGGTFLLNADCAIFTYPIPPQIIDYFFGTALINYDKRVRHSL